ncbi:peptidase S8/S53 domain-containing protein [Blastocladiella britannica]|nr:peptidase S8/S53 domain-containing protein [Blastocladiella britannica]
MDGVYRFDTEGGLHATVYVLDSGINADHSEFGNFDGSPGSRASMNYTTIPAEPLTDAGSHGTGVAAVIGGRDSGVAKQTTLVGIKVMSTSSTNATSSGLLAGLLQVYNLEKNSPRPRSAIVNLSLATTSPPSSADTAYPEEKAIQQLMSMGIPVVVAAGNDNVNACRMIPARVKGVITVAGTAYDPAAAKQVRWEKSNYGKCVQIFAPATGIRTADAGPQNSEFAIVQGTSFAAPYVSGALAVLISQGYTGPQAWSYLKARAQIDGVSGISQGEPNLFLRLPPAIDVNPDPPVFGAGTDADVFDSGAWSADGVALDAAASGNGNGNGGNPAIGSTASAIGDTEGGGGISTGGWVGIAIGIVAVVGAVAAVVATKLVRRRRHQRAQWTPVVAQD